MAYFNFLKSKLAASMLPLMLLFTKQSHAGYAIQDDCFASLAEANTAEHYSPAGTQLFQWLYGTEGLDWMRVSVLRILRGISQNSRPVEGQPQGGAGTADVVLKKVLLLMKIQHQFPVTKEFLQSKLDCSLAMAFAFVPDVEDENEQPDTLQICPWFLDYAMKQDAQFQSQFSAGKVAWTIKNFKLDRLATWVAYTPIDLFQLFDKVLVHELSHTRRGGELDDVGGFFGYGWKNCRQLSAQRGDKSPHRNADTIALFGSISGLIVKGGKMHEDGTFDKPPEGGDGNEDNDGDAQEDAGEATKRKIMKKWAS
ncbi:hypothetical protein MGN70_010323 [Eutypa lata]|nr:hypothetical protein MGN70_010323 [Eutypa lata]